MAAVRGGQCLDTSMGFTPLEGLLMGTRCGDLDPAVVPFLMERMQLDSAQIEELLNKRSGLLGVSGVSNDMRDVLAAAEAGHERAQAAVELFCYRVRKYLGAYAAAMGGLDAIVFTAGIGENSPQIRSKCVEDLQFLGVEIDEHKNHHLQLQGRAADISKDDAPVRVFVIPTNEELLIARDTAALVSRGMSGESG
jgi:acetate kinase